MVAEKDDMVVSERFGQHVVLEAFCLHHYLRAAETAFILVVDKFDVPHHIVGKV